MKLSHWLILVLSIPCLVYPTWALRIRDESATARSSPKPSAPLRRRPGSRFSDSSLIQQPQRQQKTELVTINPEDGYLSETGIAADYDSTTRPPFVRSSLRRNYARLTGTTTQEPGEFTTKPVKSKSPRRRKVKRPPKLKLTTPKVTEEEIGQTNSTGDKNLALEIGSDDGKYALIDKFFGAPPSQAPGILSYLQSQDFSHDNDKTLGNVPANDIWLSDGHLLVLKGGDFDSSLRDTWKPIDDYQRDHKAPPLRIPLDTNNPPPFPVFLNRSGPPIFLGPPPPFGLPYPPPGAYGNESFDPSAHPPPGLIPLFPNGTIPDFGFPPGGFGGGNNSLPFYPYPGPPNGYGGVNGNGNVGVRPGGNHSGLYPPPGHPFPFPPPGGFNNGSFPPPYPFPFPPPGGDRNGSLPHFFPPPPGYNQNFTGGGPPPGFPFLPPLVLNPNDNETDDPSIFLPPPYDFDYYEDNSSLVPPGPFAPGLVVPPPKEFYQVYNRTKRPTPPISTTYNSYLGPPGKRPQRPNGKKPKFPITNPPDDSLEAYIPHTTPYPTVSVTPPKKRKQRPGKSGVKGVFGQAIPKYTLQNDNQQHGPIVTTILPIRHHIAPQRNVIGTPRPVITTTISTTTTHRPQQNYVYVRGQLKTLAEIAAEQAAEEEYDYDPTPRPPYDERGYPTRIVDEPEPIIRQYPKKITTPEPPKSYYYSTPKYENIYSPTPSKPKSRNPNSNAYIFPTVSSGVIPSQSPVPPVRTNNNNNNNNNNPSSLYINPNGNRNNQLSNQGQIVFNPNNYQQQKGAPVGPAYFTATAGGNVQPQRQPQLTQFQSPQYTINGQRQPHSYTHTSIPQSNSLPRTTTGFRPAFGSTQQQRQQPQRSRLHFPGQVSQSGPIFNTRTPIYQQQTPHNQGYYSPITQYHQPLEPNPTPFHQNQYFQAPGSAFQGGGRNRQQSNNIYQKQQQRLQQQQPYFYPQQQQQQQQNLANHQQQQQQQQQQYNPSLVGRYVQQPQIPLHQDILVNYREPLPQYNTESEAVTTRSVVKAGPSPGPETEQIGANSVKPALLPDGSFYSFQRGGPGGFSYKIRL